MNQPPALQDTSLKQIVQIFRKRREYARVILEMSKQQYELVKADKYPELLELLAQKQQIVNAAEQLSSQYSELWSNWKIIREVMSDVQKDECQQLIEATEADFQELVQSEQTGTDELKLRRDKLQKQLSMLSQGQVAHHAYHEDSTPTSHIDIGK